LEGYWGHRNLFGRAEKLRIDGAISGIGSNDLSQLNYNAGINVPRTGRARADRQILHRYQDGVEHPDGL